MRNPVQNLVGWDTKQGKVEALYIHYATFYLRREELGICFSLICRVASLESMLWKWFDRLDKEGIRKSRQLGLKGELEKKMASFIMPFQEESGYFCYRYKMHCKESWLSSFYIQQEWYSLRKATKVNLLIGVNFLYLLFILG